MKPTRGSKPRPVPAAPPRETAPAPSWLRLAIVALTALLIVAWTSTEVSDPDTWWHLKTGQYILQHRSLPVPDPFAYTTYLHPPVYALEEATRYFNLTHEWLAQIGMYVVFTSAGYPGLILLRCALLTAFCGLVGLAAWRRTKDFYLGVGAALAAASVAVEYRADRPYILTFACLAAVMAILEYRRRLWLLPPLFLLWANSHGGFFMGWVVLGAYCAEALYERWRGRPPADERRLWLAAIASIAVSGLNPNFFRVIPVMIAYRKSVMQATLWEWQYPLPWPPSAFSILLAGAAILLLWARRRTRPVDWLLLAAFGVAALSAVRNIILAALVGPLVIASYVPWRRVLPVAAQWAIAGLLLVGAAVPLVQGRAFQFRGAEWKFPAAAADFLVSHNIRGRLFNTYELGGYLLWRLAPERPVFIDGRALSETVYMDYQRMVFNAAASKGAKSGEELLRDYGIEVILMDGFEFTSGQPYLLPAALSDPKQTEWKLVYRDAQAVIYMRHPAPGLPVLPSFEALAAMEDQCTTYVQNAPGQGKCAAGLMDLFVRIGDAPRARKWQAITNELGLRH